jgi:hypothetical protein
VQLSRALATACAKDIIQVNCVLPGWIDTDLTRRAGEQVPGLDGRVVSRTPQGRRGRPEDRAETAVFLASSASGFITGTAIRSTAAIPRKRDVPSAPAPCADRSCDSNRVAGVASPRQTRGLGLEVGVSGGASDISSRTLSVIHRHCED